MEAETKTQQNNIEVERSADDVISWFNGVAETAGLVQMETLRQILELNSGVEYLKPWLGEVKIQDLDDLELEYLYRNTVPVANHSDFEPFLQRIADGDTSPLLTRCPVTALSRTSGTTEGRYKYIPFTNHFAQLTLQLSSLAEAITLRAYPTSNEGKILGFIHCYKQYETKGGIKVGAVSSHLLSSESFKAKQQNSKTSLCSPVNVIFSEDYKQSTYCHLLLGLFFSDKVKTVVSIFAYAIVQAFNELEDLWRELCSDLREGSLSPKISCPKLRKAVLDIISPSPSLASRIEASCEVLEGSDWFGVMAVLWPKAVYVGCVVTGSMQPYVKKLKHYAGDLQVVGRGYVSSEAFIGVNLDPTSPPEEVTFTVVPNATYFEFIPQKQDRYLNNDFKEPDPIRLSEVEAGQEYEIILTTFNGLYRYRLGDIVEVVGFYKETPKLKFIRREKIILSITVEKTSEKDLEPVIEKASEMLGKSNAEIVDFTTHAAVAVQPGHYIIYLEIKGEVDDQILRECCTEMDASFLQMAYVTSRKFKSIGPLELCILGKGTFKKIMECFERDGGTLSQFKTPRSTNKQAFLDILNSSTLKRFRSTAHE